jgi:hypothetical protein
MVIVRLGRRVKYTAESAASTLDSGNGGGPAVHQAFISKDENRETIQWEFPRLGVPTS